MAAITEDYVSFEIAKLLKEKGFMKGAIVKFFASGYDSKGNILDIRDTELKDYPRPTLQMTMKWLREVCGLHVWVDYSRFDFNKEHPYLWNIVETKIDGDYWGGSYHKHPEEAVEEAIKYCLENLI